MDENIVPDLFLVPYIIREFCINRDGLTYLGELKNDASKMKLNNCLFVSFLNNLPAILFKTQLPTRAAPDGIMFFTGFMPQQAAFSYQIP